MNNLTRFFRHLRVLVKKNVLIKLRKPLSTLLEFSFPFQLVFALYILTLFSGQQLEKRIDAPENNISTLNFFKDKKLSVTSSAPLILDTVVSPFVEALKLQYPGSGVEVLASKDEYLKRSSEYAANLHFQMSGDQLELVIVNRTQVVLSSGLTQKIRNQTEVYLETGIVQLQNIIAKTFVQEKYPNTKFNLEIKTKEYPVKGFSQNIMEMVFGFIYPFYFSMTVMVISSPLLVSLMTEKKARLKTGLQMMGCSMSAYTVSWTLTTVVEALFTSVSITVMLYLLKILTKTNPILFFYIYFGYLLSFIPFVQAFCLLFKDPKYSALLFNMLFLLSVFAWITVRVLLTVGVNVAAAQFGLNLLSPFAFCELMYIITVSEGINGLGFSNLSEYSSMNYSVPLGLIYIALDVILYNLLGLYLERVIPNEGGKSEGMFFFLSPSFWRKATVSARRSAPIHQGEGLELEDDSTGTGSGVTPGIEVSNLSKVFKEGILKPKTTTAVENLTLTVNKGEIFALLGHNGAGKSTTINMIIGNLQPTAGSFKVNGLSGETEMEAIRQQLGVCLQEDLIFEKLTAQEHMELYATIKDVPPGEMQQEIENRLDQVGLTSERHNKPFEFSGGMKRRLSFAIAMLGDSPFIVLDEPTSGLDPMNRRNVWNVLQQCKKYKTILLTSHSMEEADLLADRIAIMKKGKLEALGSSLSLKNHYGVGYTLHCVKNSDCQETAVDEFVGSHIPNYRKQERAQLGARAANATHEINYLLPYQSVSQFPTFLKDLEKNLKTLHLQSYGLSVSTLEEVFLKINEDINLSE